TGILISAAITGIIQSSGATLGIAFAFASAGVFTHLSQAIPLVLGAHIGTCVTALLGCIGTHIDAKRTAGAHLLFNLINVALGAAALPWLVRWIPALTGDLTRQIAHVHTLVMILGALVVVPLTRPFEWTIRRIIGFNRPSPAPSHLDRALLTHPERALHAAILEIRRVLTLASESLQAAATLLFENRPRTLRKIRHNEQFINEIRSALLSYLAVLAEGYLSRRQIMLSQHLDRCIAEVERIGDHICKLADIASRRDRKESSGYVDAASFRDLLEAFRQAACALRMAELAFDPDPLPKQPAARAILQARDRYMKHSRETQDRFAERVSAHDVTPVASLFFSEYLASLDRLVQHLRILALALHHSDFRIKADKLDQPARPAPPRTAIQRVEAEEFMKQLETDRTNVRLPENQRPDDSAGAS
ncbi:MAG: Na/Pi symporter, partial [Kiritimatiellia bacterium]|nr:Na/Pi symporter [Kiritimatiellia bacterium]